MTLVKSLHNMYYKKKTFFKILSLWFNNLQVFVSPISSEFVCSVFFTDSAVLMTRAYVGLFMLIFYTSILPNLYILSFSYPG
jgi:hypothetical protein